MSSPRTTPTSPGSPRGTEEPDPIRTRLLAYRVMAYVAGVSLLALCASLILEYGFGNDVISWVAIPHGWLYLIYLITVVLLGTAARWSYVRMLLVALAGTIPLMSFVAEHKIRHRVEAERAGDGTTRAASDAAG